MLEGIVTQNEKGDKVGNYSLSKRVLNCCSSRGRDPKLEVPAAAKPSVFTYFHEPPLGHLGGREDNK